MKRNFYLRWMLSMLCLIVAAVGCDDDDNLNTPEPEDLLALEISVSDVTDHDVRFKITPSSNDVDYAYGVIPSSAISGKTDAEIITIVAGNKPQTAHGEKKGRFDNLQAETVYMVWAVGYANGHAGSLLAKSVFQTLAAPETPELLLKAEAGDKEGLNTDSAISVTIRSKTAVKCRMLLKQSMAMRELLAQGNSLEEVILEQQDAHEFTTEELAVIQGDGITIVYSSLEADTPYTVACRIESADKVVMVKDVEVRTDSVKNPEVSLEGAAGDVAGEHLSTCVTFKARCLSKDAVYAAYLKSPTDQIEEVLADGMTLEDVMNFTELTTPFKKEEMERFVKGDEIAFEMHECLAKSSYTMVLDVKNASDRRTIKRADVLTGEAVGGGPEISIEPGLGDDNGEHKDTIIRFRVRCMSGDATYGSYYLATTNDFTEELGTMSIEQFMDRKSISFEHVNSKWLGLFNRSEGLLLQPHEEMTPETAYTFVLEARNAEGGRTITQTEVVTEARVTVAPKIGDYFYSDGTWSDGGLVSIDATGINPVWVDQKPAPVAGKTVIGIVFQTMSDRIAPSDRDKGFVHGYVIATQTAHSSEKLTTYWTEIPDFQGLKGVKLGSSWYNNVNGYDETMAVWEKFMGNPEQASAFDLILNKFTPAPASTSGWFLPSTGQLWDMVANLCGGEVAILMKDWRTMDYDATYYCSGRVSYDVIARFNSVMELVPAENKVEMVINDDRHKFCSLWTSSAYEDEAVCIFNLGNDGLVECMTDWYNCDNVARPILAF